MGMMKRVIKIRRKTKDLSIFNFSLFFTFKIEINV